MSDEEPTSSGAPAFDSRRVPAYKASDSEALVRAASNELGPDGTAILPTAEPAPSAAPSIERAPSSVGAAPAPDPAATPAKSSAELAERSRKQRRRERDARAEKTAQRVVIGGTLAVGAVALLVVNYSGLIEDEPRTVPKPTASASASPKPQPRLSAAPDETPDLPALSALKASGLTLAAEGLPEVVAVAPPNPPPLLAGIETCRFAYGVWELSPNRAFRFLTTCPVFQGQQLVGAYEVRGSKLIMSPLLADGAELLMVLELEKPSKMTTTVNHNHKGNIAVLEVRQSITAIRPGMDGDTFVKSYAPKNNVEISGMARPNRAPAPAPERDAPPAPKESDPVLELLKGGQ